MKFWHEVEGPEEGGVMFNPHDDGGREFGPRVPLLTFTLRLVVIHSLFAPMVCYIMLKHIPDYNILCYGILN